MDPLWAWWRHLRFRDCLPPVGRQWMSLSPNLHCPHEVHSDQAPLTANTELRSINEKTKTLELDSKDHRSFVYLDSERLSNRWCFVSLLQDMDGLHVWEKVHHIFWRTPGDQRHRWQDRESRETKDPSCRPLKQIHVYIMNMWGSLWEDVGHLEM